MREPGRRAAGRHRVAMLLVAARQLGSTYMVGHEGVKHRITDGWVPAEVLERTIGRRFSARLYDAKRDGLSWEKKRLKVNGRLTQVWLYRAVEYAGIRFDGKEVLKRE